MLTNGVRGNHYLSFLCEIGCLKNNKILQAVKKPFLIMQKDFQRTLRHFSRSSPQFKLGFAVLIGGAISAPFTPRDDRLLYLHVASVITGFFLMRINTPPIQEETFPAG